MNEIFLTVAIPTFNRASFLDKTIKDLITQVSALKNTEILICDNASSDNTKDVVQHYMNIFPFVRYIRNEVNLGLDGNVFTAYHEAYGEYIWFVCDDDIILNNSLSLVLESLHTCRPYVLTMGSRQMGESETIDNLHRNRDYFSWEDEGAAKEFLSVIMLTRLIVKKLDLNIKNLLLLSGTLFPQVTLCLEILKIEFRFSVRNDVIIERNPAYKSKNFFEVYCLNIRLAIRHASWKEANNSLIPATEVVLQDFIFLEIMERAGAYTSIEGLPIVTWLQGWEEFGYSFGNKLRLVIILIISFMPRFLARIIYFFMILRSVRRPQKAAQIYTSTVRRFDGRTVDV